MLTSWLRLDEARRNFVLKFSLIFSAKTKDKANVGRWYQSKDDLECY